MMDIMISASEEQFLAETDGCRTVAQNSEARCMSPLDRCCELLNTTRGKTILSEIVGEKHLNIKSCCMLVELTVTVHQQAVKVLLNFTQSCCFGSVDTAEKGRQGRSIKCMDGTYFAQLKIYDRAMTAKNHCRAAHLSPGKGWEFSK